MFVRKTATAFALAVAGAGMAVLGSGSAFADEPQLTTHAVYNTFDECSAAGDDLVAKCEVDIWSCDPTGEGDKTALNVHYV
jgi:hypothetical protein